jgi:crossover junction endodeoxyribonuclease RuvC
MFVLGIDPGLTRCGFGVVTRSGGSGATIEAVAAGVLETDADLGVDLRLAQLLVDVEALLDEVRPDWVAVERIFFQANARTAVSVAQASGIILASAARRGIPTAQYSPNEVKQSVVGHGAATKSQVASMVAQLCGLAAPPSPPDAADALALAICHLTGLRLSAAIEMAKVRR